MPFWLWVIPTACWGLTYGIPGQPVAYTHGLFSIKHGLLKEIVAFFWFSGNLAFQCSDKHDTSIPQNMISGILLILGLATSMRDPYAYVVF